MFGSLSSEQWRERVRHSTTRQIHLLVDAMRHPAYALARVRNSDAHAQILAICDAELALRATATSTLADIVPPYDNDLTRTTRE